MVSLDYLAGFVDGEGSLSLARKPRRGSPEYCVRVSIANTNREILGEIQQELGGTIAESRRRNPKWKLGYSLIWTNAAAVGILRRIAPHLRVKSSNAVALLEYTEHVIEYGRPRDRKGRILPLSKEEMKVREAYHERLRRLNARGPREPGDAGRTAGEESRRKETGSISLPYLAGFIDGEGSLMIARCFVRRYGTTQYRSRLTMANSDRRILVRIKRDYGGILVTRVHPQAKWKDGYQLVWTSGLIRQYLPLLLPHLRVKREQAALLLDFLRHVTETPRLHDRRGRAPHPKSVLDFRETLYRKMRGLNARGSKALPG